MMLSSVRVCPYLLYKVYNILYWRNCSINEERKAWDAHYGLWHYLVYFICWDNKTESPPPLFQLPYLVFNLFPEAFSICAQHFVSQSFRLELPAARLFSFFLLSNPSYLMHMTNSLANVWECAKLHSTDSSYFSPTAQIFIQSIEGVRFAIFSVPGVLLGMFI